MAVELFDVVAVNIKTSKVRMMTERKTERNAEAFVNMAVMRRGVEDEFFSYVPAGRYHEGDKWTGRDIPKES